MKPNWFRLEATREGKLNAGTQAVSGRSHNRLAFSWRGGGGQGGLGEGGGLGGEGVCKRREKGGALFVGWLLFVPTTRQCISETDLFRQWYV